MVKKIRIQLLTKEGIVTSDRLVDQEIEFYQGPKEKHKDPLKVEVTLTNTEDINKFITYLQKVALDLPIEVKSPRGRTATKNHQDTALDNSREVLLEELLSTAKDQDDFIRKLREYDFIFLESDRLKQLIPEAYSIKSVHLEKYQWMIRVSKRAKDPRNDKFDLPLLIGIAIMDKESRTDKMVIYLNGTFNKSVKLEVPKNAMTFKQTNLIKYPHYMTYEEREKWSIEHRLLLNNPEKKPSKFYLRWAKDVKVGDELKLKHKTDGKKEKE